MSTNVGSRLPLVGKTIISLHHGIEIDLFEIDHVHGAVVHGVIVVGQVAGFAGGRDLHPKGGSSLFNLTSGQTDSTRTERLRN